MAAGEGPSSCLRPEELTLLLNGLEATPRRHWFGQPYPPRS
jgi:hypothetical protein